MLRIDDATIYQMFYLWYTGHSFDEIQRQTGCTKTTIRIHLAHRYFSQYRDSLMRRIRPIVKPPLASKPIPAEYITLSDASYFYHTRPSAKTIRTNYMRRNRSDETKLRVALIDGRTLTRKEWVLDHLEHFIEPRPGIYFRKDAFSKITGTEPERTFTNAIEVATLPPITPATISRTLGIMSFTGLPYITLTADDIV